MPNIYTLKVIPYEMTPRLCEIYDQGLGHYWLNVPLNEINRVLDDHFTRRYTAPLDMLMEPETIKVTLSYNDEYDKE